MNETASTRFISIIIIETNFFSPAHRLTPTRGVTASLSLQGTLDARITVFWVVFVWAASGMVAVWPSNVFPSFHAFVSFNEPSVAVFWWFSFSLLGISCVGDGTCMSQCGFLDQWLVFFPNQWLFFSLWTIATPVWNSYLVLNQRLFFPPPPLWTS